MVASYQGNKVLVIYRRNIGLDYTSVSDTLSYMVLNTLKLYDIIVPDTWYHSQRRYFFVINNVTVGNVALWSVGALGVGEERRGQFKCAIFVSFRV